MEPEPKGLQLPNRPQRSKNPSNIRPLKLVSNHLPIKFSDGNKYSTLISLYSLHFEPEIESRRLIREVIEAGSEDIKKEVGFFNFSGLLLFAMKKKESTITIPITSKEKKEYMVSLKYAREFDLLNLQNEKNSKEIKPIIQFLNVVIKQSMKNLGMNEMGRTSKYVYNDKKSIKSLDKYGLEVRTGFKTSIFVSSTGARLIVDYCSRILRSDTAYDFIKYMKGDKKEIEYALVGSSVLADYGEYRYYKVDAIDWKKTPKSLFTSKTGDISFIQYYQDKYHIKISQVDQPLIVSKIIRKDPQGNKVEHEVLLIPSLCRMTGLPEGARNDRELMKDLSYYTKLDPTKRMDHAAEHVKNLNGKLSKLPLKLEIDDSKGQGFKFDGTQIRVPEIQFSKEVLKPSENGSFQLRNKLLQPCVLQNWILLYSGRDKRDDDDVEQFYLNMQKAAGTFGIKVMEPFYVLVESIQSKDYIKYLEQYVDKKTQLVVAFIPPSAKDKVYKAFKKFCAQDRPVPSQVVVKNSVFKNAMSVCSKIICQINAKLGLSLWVSQIPENLPKKTMLIGADVHHGKGRSVVGLCASFDENFTKYYSRIKVQHKKNEEIFQNVSTLVSDAIKKYFSVNKYLPENIIFYRDGVGEGQFLEVQNIEIPNIMSGFEKISKDYKPNFCEIIVTKKINDRFFTPNGGDAKFYNPPSGTWVSSEVVSKNYDFFLCAQNVTQGTCTPTHYTVLFNNTNIAEDVLAKLTYYQCFNYYNWTGAIRVPACVQYSSKLAFLVGQTLQADPHESLWDKLYFL